MGCWKRAQVLANLPMLAAGAAVRLCSCSWGVGYSAAFCWLLHGSAGCAFARVIWEQVLQSSGQMQHATGQMGDGTERGGGRGREINRQSTELAVRHIFPLLTTKEVEKCHGNAAPGNGIWATRSETRCCAMMAGKCRRESHQDMTHASANSSSLAHCTKSSGVRVWCECVMCVCGVSVWCECVWEHMCACVFGSTCARACLEVKEWCMLWQLWTWSKP